MLSGKTTDYEFMSSNQKSKSEESIRIHTERRIYRVYATRKFPQKSIYTYKVISKWMKGKKMRETVKIGRNDIY